MRSHPRGLELVAIRLWKQPSTAIAVNAAKDRASIAVRRDRDVQFDDLLRCRRVGKTSLLKGMVNSYPPKAGGICAAFFDCYGLNTPPGTMAKTFFDWIVSKLNSEASNEPVRVLLRQQGGKPVMELARGLKPETCLEDSLEELVRRIEQDSRGIISRMVFFIDEFDRFVEPYLDDRKDEVVRLHGSLRQIIQLP